MAVEIPEQKEKKTTVGLLFIGLIIATSVTVIGFAMALTTSHSAAPAKQCGQIAVKMFDNNNVPKYFVGSGYKITPMGQGTTEAVVNICR
jgi:hypothetical protein